ncbi:hypothetical protein CSO01_13900 [Cellulomonas soli]|uniref:TraD/TraG TraM recognition site domain-containing protein n=1 Tax=Cellulomonas soli TaxID=931535 RepID=A0A512PBV0_9CELL|nr:hypothetical protein CSO01_13900 [Cellulomonas soli]
MLEAARPRTVTRRARHARPSLPRPHPREVGYLLGRSHGAQAWASVEDSILVVGPPRSGKGHVVIPMLFDAPGAVVTTSTRPDNLAATYAARREIGPVAVFDPQALAAGVPDGFRWSPVRGCDVPQIAMIRARGLAAGTGISRGTSGGDFWQAQTETVLRALLHAAALDGRAVRDLYRWSLDPAAVTEAITILGRPSAALGWDKALEQAANSGPRTRDSIWLGVRQALFALADPRVLDAVSPREGEEFDPAAFLRDRGTLYVLGTASGAGAAAPIVAALVEDMVETARRIAAASPGARLDPPLLLALDEIGNLAPLPPLPACRGPSAEAVDADCSLGDHMRDPHPSVPPEARTRRQAEAEDRAQLRSVLSRVVWSTMPARGQCVSERTRRPWGRSGVGVRSRAI